MPENILDKQLLACVMLNTSGIEQFIQYGANVNTYNSQGKTVLQLSTEGFIKEIIPVRKGKYLKKICALLENGADPNIRDNEGNTPLHFLITNFLSLSQTNRSIRIEEYTCLIKILINNMAIPSTKNDIGETPLQLIVEDGYLEVLKLLLTEGNHYNINVVNDEGKTALHLVAENKNISATRLLVAKKADPNIRDANGNTPLHIAIINEQTKIAEELLKRNASILVKNNNGETPLSLAVKMAQSNIVNILLKIKTANKSTNDNRQTILHTAIEYYLKNFNTPLKIKYLEIINSILYYGINPNAQDVYGNTPLHLLIERCSVKKDPYELKISIWENHIKEVVKLLSTHGASPYISNERNESPLSMAEDSSVIMVLLKKDTIRHVHFGNTKKISSYNKLSFHI